MTRWRLVLGLAIASTLVLAWFLPVGDWTLRLAETMRGAGALGVILFILAYVVWTVAVLPGSLLTLAAGFAYGPIGGLLVASPASVAGATAAFVLGRSVLRGWAERKLADSPRARAVDRAVGRDSFKIVMLLRLSPLVPFNLLNYALSLSSVDLGRYVAASFLGMLPVTWLYVYLGSLATAAAGLTAATERGGGLRTAVYVAGLGATIVLVVVTTRRAKKVLKDEVFKKEGGSKDLPP